MTDHDTPQQLPGLVEPGDGPTIESPVQGPPDVDNLGMRLRAAREARQLQIAECAGRLHLPIKVLQRLEANDFGTPEHFVFVRGALRSYVQFLGLPGDSCDDVLRDMAPAEQPALVSVARTSAARWLLQRYGTAATYIVLTATIAVPLVLLGLRGGLERPATRIVSLDHATTAPAAAAPQTSAEIGQAGSGSPDVAPFRASMTPFAAIGLGATTDVTPAEPVAKAPIPVSIADKHALTVAARDDCWFEITDAAGNKVESGMLRAGDSRVWHSTGTLHVTLGNAAAVTVTRDGEPLALEPYQRANVAHFDVFAAEPGSGENE